MGFASCDYASKTKCTKVGWYGTKCATIYYDCKKKGEQPVKMNCPKGGCKSGGVAGAVLAHPSPPPTPPPPADLLHLAAGKKWSTNQNKCLTNVGGC